jgi:putative tricarboxylic transport membrane protein
MLESAIDGLIAAVQWPAIGYLLLGILLGIYFGAVPGLSGLTGMALLLPFTFGMEPVSAFSFLLGMYAVTTTSDSIPAILIGVPGTAAAQATVLDGFPMAQRGEAMRAFGAAFTCSAIGGVIGGVMMGLSIPIVQPLVLSFAQPEFFMLGVLGLTMVGALSGRSILKGLAAAALGLLLSQVGYSEQGAIPRYWLGSTYLLDGLSLVPVVLGLFAVPELVSMAVSNKSISKLPQEAVKGGILTGMRDAFEHRWLLLRSSFIGIYIGMLPALGSTIADWVAYGHATQSAKDKSQFGKGDVRGLIAPEAANNSCKGGELVPTVAFGIPGSAPMAILLGAFLVQGLTPGPEMLTTKLSVTYSMMWSLIMANVIAAVLLLMWARQLQRIIFIPAHLVVPGVAFFVLVGSWTANSNIGDWISLIVFGIVGTFMKRAGWPRPPMVLGFVLGRIMESSLHLSMAGYGIDWIWRPICIVIAILIVTTLFMAVKSQMSPEAAEKEEALPASEQRAVAGLSAIVGIGAGAVLIYAIVAAQPWPANVKLFPLAFAIPAAFLVGFAVMGDVWRLIRPAAPSPAAGGSGPVAPAITVGTEITRSLAFISWLVAVAGATVLFGQHVALTVFIFIYLIVWGRYSWWIALIYAAGTLGLMVLLFDVMSPTNWYPALVPQWLGY